MSRSGYIEDDDDPLATGRWRAQVNNAIRGKRGQSFLRELAAAMDAMPVKELIADELINEEGQCCTIGVICKARGVDVSKVDYEDPEQVAKAAGIAHQMAQEIEYYNDECGYDFVKVAVELAPDAPKWTPDFRWDRVEETPEERWTRMRKWVEKHIKQTPSS